MRGDRIRHHEEAHRGRPLSAHRDGRVIRPELLAAPCRPIGFVTPQFGIFAQGAHAHHFLEFEMLPGATSEKTVDSVRRLLSPEVSSGRINLVVAFGPKIWRALAP